MDKTNNFIELGKPFFISPLNMPDIPSPLYLGFSLFMGLSVPEYFSLNPLSFEPVWIADLINTLGRTGMAVGAVTALGLDNTIPGTDEERGLSAWRRDERS